MNSTDIENALSKNANDFIARAVEAYNNRDNKAAVINLWSGVLLLLKIWIFRKQPSLIYSRWEDIVKFEDGELVFSPFVADGSYQTVDYNAIKSRFRFLGNSNSLLFNNDTILKDIQNKRNRIEHFVHDIPEREITTVFVKVLPFINDFIEQELNEKANDFLECWDDFLQIDELFRHRLKIMEDFIEEISPSVREIRHGGVELVKVDCPNCGRGKLINSEENTLYCRACEYRTTYIECNRCSRVYPEDDIDIFIEKTGICSECFEEICKNSD